MINYNLKISVKTQPGRCPHGTRFSLNPWGYCEVSHQSWHPSQNLVRIHYSAVCGERSHRNENTRLVALFKRWYQLMIPHVEFRWRVCIRNYILLRHHINIVLTQYLLLHPYPVLLWRRGQSGSSSFLCHLTWYHIPYSYSFSSAQCARVFTILQKFLVWSCRCRSLPHFSIPSSRTSNFLGLLFSGCSDMLISVSLCSNTASLYFFMYWIYCCQTGPVPWWCALTVYNGRCWMLLLLALRTRTYLESPY